MIRIFSKTLALSLLLAAMLGVVELAKIPLLQYRANQQSIEDLRGQLSRYAAITAARETERQSLQRFERRWERETLTIDAPNTSRAVAELQERVKSAVEGGGAKLMSTRILPVKEEGPFFRVAAHIRLQASSDNLGPALLGLESGFPYLFLDQVSISSQGRPVSASGGVSLPLNVTLEVSGYLRPGEADNEGSG